MSDMPDVRAKGRAVVAYTTEDDQHAEVRRAAEAHALEHGCVLILYAADVASAFSDPMPNQWASEGEGDRFGDRLSPEDLEMLGRAGDRRAGSKQPSSGREGGRLAAQDKGVQALAEYAAAEGAHSVFVSQTLDAIDELRESLAAGGGGSVAQTAIDLKVVPGPEPRPSNDHTSARPDLTTPKAASGPGTAVERLARLVFDHRHRGSDCRRNRRVADEFPRGSAPSRRRIATRSERSSGARQMRRRCATSGRNCRSRACCWRIGGSRSRSRPTGRGRRARI